MNTAPVIRNVLHHLHDGAAKATHATSHLFHEKAFWALLAVVALIAALFALVVIYGQGNVMPSTPMPFAPYY